MSNPARPRRTRPRVLVQVSSAVLLIAAILTSPAVSHAGESAPVTIDPFISSLLDSVDTDRMMSRVQSMVDFYTRHTWSCTTCVDTGVGAARKWAHAEMESISAWTGGDLATSYFSWYQFPGPPPQRLSLYAYGELPGTMPESQGRIFGTGAHFDSRTVFLTDATGFAPGANDDGSGCVAVLEMAHIMSAYDWETSLEFHLFTGEEQGLLGSERYAIDADTTGKDIRGIFSLDTIGEIENADGQVDSTRLRSFAPDSALSHNMQRYAKRVGEAYVPGQEIVIKPIRDREGRGGDHLSFCQQNFTAIRFIEMRENLTRQHSNNDLIDYMVPSYLGRNTRMTLACLASLALAPASPTGLSVDVTAEGHLRLTWPMLNTEPDFAGYLVAYRPPDFVGAYDETSTVSAHAFTMVDVGLVTEHLLVGPAAGESVYVGIAALDDAGHESLVSREIGAVMPQATSVGSPIGEPLLFGLGEPRPNPAGGSVELALSVGLRASSGELAVYDVEGRRVRTLHRGTVAPGARTVRWDLSDEEGRRVPAGAYFIRMEMEGAVAARKLIVTP